MLVTQDPDRTYAHARAGCAEPAFTFADFAALALIMAKSLGKRRQRDTHYLIRAKLARRRGHPRARY
jgi:hypothetical protein